MKQLLMKRIIILISMAIVMSSILISFSIAVLSGTINGIEELEAFIKYSIISVIIVMPFVIGISYGVLKKITYPIRDITRVALSIIEGDFSVRADESINGQLGLVSRTMNEISVKLYKNISQLFIEKNRLHQVLNSLDEGMIAVDEEGIVTHYNNVLLEMFLLHKDDIENKKIDDVENVRNLLNELEQAIKGQYPILKNGNFKERILRTIIAPIENEKCEVVGAVILFRDITELEKLESMRKEYVANVSHELRSPLTSIRGLIEPLMDSIVTEEVDKQRYYGIIYQESLRLSRLVDDIMELSRLQTNEALIQKAHFKLNDVIEMVYERFEILDNDIELIFNPIELPDVYSNYDRIEQVLVILLDNAHKFTPEGGHITIKTALEEEQVIVSVKDTGMGISEADLPFIFDRFYKSDKSRTKKGTGLGLSIAKEVLSLMDEEICVTSEVGKGTTFAFTVHFEN